MQYRYLRSAATGHVEVQVSPSVIMQVVCNQSVLDAFMRM